MPVRRDLRTAGSVRRCERRAVRVSHLDGHRGRHWRRAQRKSPTARARNEERACVGWRVESTPASREVECGKGELARPAWSKQSQLGRDRPILPLPRQCLPSYSQLDAADLGLAHAGLMLHRALIPARQQAHAAGRCRQRRRGANVLQRASLAACTARGQTRSKLPLGGP